jgi:membrane protease YdiL (CAAX protease family)
MAGVVTRFMMERFGRLPGIVFGAVIFAIAHWAAFNPLLLVASLGCGFFWNWLYAVTDDLTIPTVSHLLWDFLLLFVFPAVT